MQLVGIKAVGHVGRQHEGVALLLALDAVEHRLHGIDLLPHLAMAIPEVAGAHVLRLEDHVLAIVEAPVLVQEPPLSFKFFMKFRAGERR